MKNTDECLDLINQAKGYEGLVKAMEAIRLDAFKAGMLEAAEIGERIAKAFSEDAKESDEVDEDAQWARNHSFQSSGADAVKEAILTAMNRKEI